MGAMAVTEKHRADGALLRSQASSIRPPSRRTTWPVV
jgi:hypothetical protein